MGRIGRGRPLTPCDGARRLADIVDDIEGAALCVLSGEARRAVGYEVSDDRQRTRIVRTLTISSAMKRLLPARPGRPMADALVCGLRSLGGGLRVGGTLAALVRDAHTVPL